MTGDHASAQQVEILARLKAGWTHLHGKGEFPFIHVLVPPSNRGGVYYQNAPFKALLDRGELRQLASGKIILA